MTDETRKAIEAYCPEIDIIYGDKAGRYRELSNKECQILAAAAVRKAITAKGGAEWEDFLYFALDSDKCPVESFGAKFMAWIMDAETFNRIAGEWVKSKGGR
jgi:hypothetical protein